MKINSTKKIIVSTLSLAMGAALAGSVAGSVAWYQYSTRASASMVSTAAGTSRNLLVSGTGADGTWSTYVDLSNADDTLKPVRAMQKEADIVDGESDLTDKAIDATAAEDKIYFFDKPVYQYENSGKAITVADLIAKDYIIQKTLFFKVVDNKDGAGDAVVAGKPIYLQDLQIKGVSAAGKLDLSNAVRVNVESSPAGTGLDIAGATFGNVASIKQSGRLNIGGGAGLDRDGIKLDDLEGNPVFYNTEYSVYAGAEDGDYVVHSIDQINNTMTVKDKIIEVDATYVYDEANNRFEVLDAATATVTPTVVANHAALDTLVAAEAAARAANPVEVGPLNGLDGKHYQVTSEKVKYQIDEVYSQTVLAIADDKAAHSFLVNDSDPFDLQDGVQLSTTTDVENHDPSAGHEYDMARVTLTIWLEGWGLDVANGSASWNYENYIDSQVEIVARFVTEADEETANAQFKQQINRYDKIVMGKVTYYRA